MIELFSLRDRASSAGNQMKFRSGNLWYKVDFLGYEGLSEYVISSLLSFSNLCHGEYVNYELTEISREGESWNGCVSEDFTGGWQLITLDRLFQQMLGYGVNQMYLEEPDHRRRLQLVVESTVGLTGIRDFGAYMSRMLTIDALFLNEDRHAQNIALLMSPTGTFKPAPLFDHGAGLLSDTTLDYPMEGNIFDQIRCAKSRSFCQDFDEQVDLAEELYGQHLKFAFTRRDVEEILDRAVQYPESVRHRVLEIILQRRSKYRYLFP